MNAETTKRIYTCDRLASNKDMFERLRSKVLFALYQVLIVAGILLLPVGMLAQAVGIPFPFHRALGRVAPSHEE
ncbi:hypothetical protein [Halocatena pleomorpha]|uniref:Uncharacterized protein n=1 Tax=Halocatena pleomorpha TaxID=1785090 RepID=A0A3P3RAD6_9EURY|nr:hypothetical protein [Halocatena pleomorpha]RRJ30345.1 hypothetical protein EIK79_10520 [Halocatena pleomorpha]